MIDYSKTQNTLQALRLQFKFVASSYMKQVIRSCQRESEIVATLTNFMQHG